MTMTQILHAYASGQAELVPYPTRAQALNAFYVWLLQHEVRP